MCRESCDFQLYTKMVSFSLLARLKTNYQLSELVVVECYPEVIQLIAKFTIQSLQVSISDCGVI